MLRAKLRRMFLKLKPDLTVIEACSLAGRIVDMCREQSLETIVVHPGGEAWTWKRVKCKTDRDDAYKLARKDRRLVMDGILWILSTGAPWRDLPEKYGKWGTVYDLFTTCNQDGTLDDVLDRLRAALVDVGEIDLELWCIDGTSIRAARCAAGAKKD